MLSVSLAFPISSCSTFRRTARLPLHCPTRPGLQLAAVDVRGGQSRPVSHGKERVAWARISNDSETICFSRDFGGKEEHQLFTVPLTDGEEEEQLTQLSSTRVEGFNWSNGDDR